MNGSVVLTTDFGTADPYVGEMKAALLAQWARWPEGWPRPRIIDLCHDVPTGDVAAGAWLLARSAVRFPPGTVHVAVVDPGVGTSRPAVAASSGGRHFVGPGNGLLAFLRAYSDLEVAILARDFAVRARGGPLSDTFHGRDLFAVAAAHLAMGAPLGLVGAPASPDDLGMEPGGAPGRVVWIDRFGNAISDVPAPATPGVRVTLDGRPIDGPFRTFGEAPPDTPFWYRGSGGCVEFAVRDTHGASRCDWRRGLAVDLEIP